MRQGARDYIVKPVDADELMAKIKALRLMRASAAVRRPDADGQPRSPARTPEPAGRDGCRPRAPRACRPSWLAVECGARGLPLSARAGRRDLSARADACRCRTRQPWFLGVANLRGGSDGVVDLAGFVGGRAPAQRSSRPRRVAAGRASTSARSQLRAAGRPAGRPAQRRRLRRRRRRRRRRARLLRRARYHRRHRRATGRRSTCRRCRQQPQFLSISA